MIPPEIQTENRIETLSDSHFYLIPAKHRIKTLTLSVRTPPCLHSRGCVMEGRLKGSLHIDLCTEFIIVHQSFGVCNLADYPASKSATILEEHVAHMVTKGGKTFFGGQNQALVKLPNFVGIALSFTSRSSSSSFYVSTLLV